MTSSEIRQSFLAFFESKGHSIVPSSSLMPDSPNLLFTNAGMNQFVPIFTGQVKCPYNPGRAADTQKCIRAGGKHNDLDDVGLDTYHHTFFEMLGNWSFGNYFKKEAIQWAWELVVTKWGFPANRLYATVYQPGSGDPSEFDQEAHDLWAALFTAAGLDPKIHIVNGNKKDNFWMMGDTGPCGPCSELHVDLTEKGDTQGRLVNQGSPECIEIWNLVFMQFNANPDGTFTPLPAKNVDTGMGFERVTSIIQGTKGFTDFSGIISNYETDIFRPIFDALEKMSGLKYRSTLPSSSKDQSPEIQTDIAFRVIADHIRTLSFAIADGIQPGNNDRNYVLRRILRRAVRYGRSLGFKEPFFYKLVDVVAEHMGDVFPEIRARKPHVQDVIRTEEEAFNKTLDKGLALFETEVATLNEGGLISGSFAFRLYDEQGFPLDLTELMARERGLSVDVPGFEKLMEEQRNRARADHAKKKAIVTVSEEGLSIEPTKFLGYDFLETEAVVESVSAGKKENEYNVILDRSSFYAEMGGQVGDAGLIHVPGHDRTEIGLLRVVDTQKQGDLFIHRAVLAEGRAPEPGEAVRLAVDAGRRAAIQRHHTVTHLLHWALHEVVNKEATQKGSAVSPDKLTFDFNSAPLTPAQVRDIERLVNERIVENAPVSWIEVPYAEIKSRKEIMQFFGDKYGDVVRVVQIGGHSGSFDGYSMELCGGTHTRATGEIGLFRISAEAAIAAGVRRIEAIAGLEAYRKSCDETLLIKGLAGKINAPVGELEKKIDALIAQQKELEKQLKALAQKQAAATASGLLASAETLNGTPAIICEVPGVSGDDLQAIAEAIKAQFKGVVFLASGSPGSVALAAAVTPEFTAKVQAGKMIQQIAPILGGKGGGRPDSARGAGKDPSKIAEAISAAKALL
jgi:alanyl-tRNA synthetase